MQPILLVRAARPGAVFLGGRFAGEVEESREMALPVAAQGAQILQFFPYDDSLPMARKLVFSRGRPVASAWSALKGVRAVSWPCGAVEIELEPSSAQKKRRRAGAARGRNGCIGGRNGNRTAAHAFAGGQCAAMRGRARGNLARRWQRVRAQRAGGRGGPCARGGVYAYGRGICAGFFRYALGAGRASLAAEPGGLCFGGATGAAFGAFRRSGGYLAAGYARASAPLAEIVEGFDACVRMKFPLPSGENAVALLRLAGENLLEAVPVFYSASATGGTQGSYRIERLLRGEGAPCA